MYRCVAWNHETKNLPRKPRQRIRKSSGTAPRGVLSLCFLRAYPLPTTIQGLGMPCLGMGKIQPKEYRDSKAHHRLVGSTQEDRSGFGNQYVGGKPPK